MRSKNIPTFLGARVTNSTANTTLFSHTLVSSANSPALIIGQSLLIQGCYIFEQAGATKTFTVTIDIGGVTLTLTSQSLGGTGRTIYNFRGIITRRTATTAFVCFSDGINNGTVATTTNATSAVNFNANVTIEIKGQMSIAEANSGVHLEQVHLSYE